MQWSMACSNLNEKWRSRHRNREGTTSPPLINIENNPGPRKVGRKVAKVNKKARKKLSSEEKANLQLCKKQNLSITETSRLVGCGKTTVNRWWNRYQDTLTMNRKPGSGRPPKTSKRTDRWMKAMVLRHRRLSAPALAVELVKSTGIRVSAMTVRRRLNAVGIKGRNHELSLSSRHFSFNKG